MTRKIKNPHHLDHPLLIKSLEQGIKPGLKNIKTCLKELDNPQKKYKTIHVAGTNGKGSTVFFITKALYSSNIKTGSFYSPHINHLSERIRVNGTAVSETKLFALLNKISRLEKQLIKNKKITDLTYFEVLTLAAALYFKEEKVEYAVFETGMGGRLDSTNILKPEACVITTIAFDHSEYLGNTLEKIAAEKAEIIKASAYLILGDIPLRLHQIFQKNRAKATYIYKKDFYFNNRSNALVYKSQDDFNGLTADFLPPPSYQRHNFSLALKTLELLRQADKRIKKEHLISGFKDINFRGRLDIISSKPLIICDAAHNLKALQALFTFIKKTYPKRNITTIFAFAREKNWPVMAQYISRNSETAYFTIFSNKRTLEKKEILNYLETTELSNISYSNNFGKAFRNISRNNINLITGSFYLLDEAYSLIKQS